MRSCNGLDPEGTYDGRSLFGSWVRAAAELVVGRIDKRSHGRVLRPVRGYAFVFNEKLAPFFGVEINFRAFLAAAPAARLALR
jgi:hypothetical protein